MRFPNQPLPSSSRTSRFLKGFGAPNAFPSELLGCVPNTYARAPSILDGTYSPSVAMHSVLLLATRPLQDEELFIGEREAEIEDE